MSDALPPGWVLASLAELTTNPKHDIVSGPFGSNLKSEEYVAEGVPIIRLQNVDRNKFLEKNMRFITPQKAQELSAHTFQAGDIVISKLGDPLGKACIIPELLPHGVVVADVVRVRVDESHFCKRYATLAINSPAVVGQINQEIKGSTRPRVNLNHLRDLEIPLAPLAEQRRIVAKLETMLSKVDACQQRLAKIPVLLKRFRQSVLAAACSGHLTADWREENETESVEPQLLKHAQQDKKFAEALKNGQRFKSSTPFEWAMLPELPTDWCWGAAAEVVEPGAEIVYGIVQPGPEAPNGVPYVRGLDIQNGKILVDQLRRTSREIAKRYERASLKSGDVLLGIIRHTKVAIVPSSLNGGNITQGTARFRPSELISTGFLARWLESKYAQDWLHHHYRGIDMPGLNLADVRKLPVPLPPPAEQQEIVRRVEALFALADQIEARFRKAQALVDQLTPSLLARAFRGQLVPQDPTDEPAEKLLERIRQAEPRMARITRMKRKAAGP